MKSKIILGVSLIVFMLALLGVSQLEILSNMEDMLPADSESLKASQEFNEHFKGQDQVIVVVKEQGNVLDDDAFKEKSQGFLYDLAEKLQDETYVESLLYKVDTEKILPYAWGYVDMSLYEDVDEAVAAMDLLKIQEMLIDIKKDMEEAENQSAEYILNDDGTHYMMIIKPHLDENDYVGTRSIFYDGMNAEIDELLKSEEYKNLNAGLTGGAFIQDIESDAAAFDGLFATMAITLVLILLVLIIFFRELKLPLLTIYPLVLGAVVATAFAWIIYGSLNMFSVSFALLLLGLGIDFGVHLLTRYQEERNNSLEYDEASKIAVKSTGMSIIFGAATTAFAFASFAFAKFKAFKQIGIISAIGIVCLCAGMLILMPAIIEVFDKNNKKVKKQINMAWLEKITDFNLKRKWIVSVSLVVIIVALLPFVLNVKLETDMTAIYPDDIPSLKWAEEVEEAFDYNIDTISVYAKDEDQLKSAIEVLNKRDDIKNIDSIFDYMPKEQEEKLEILKRLDLMLKQNGINAFDEFNLKVMTIDDLPQSIKDNYLGNEGELRAEIIPNINIYERDDYDELMDGIYDEMGRYAVGMPTRFIEVLLLVKEDIFKISLMCLVAVFAVAIIVFKKLKLALITMTPLILTLYTTLGVLPLLNIQINVFSIAAFPLIIGIGIDSSIHLIHRLNEESELSVGKKVTNTARAILLTGITTIIGFGSLGLINHPGMANLGLNVVVGIGISMVYTLVVVPVGFAVIKK